MYLNASASHPSWASALQIAAGLLTSLLEQSSTGDCRCPHLPVGHFHPAHPLLHARLPPFSSIPATPLDPVEKDHPGIEAASASNAAAEDAQRFDQQPLHLRAFQGWRLSVFWSLPAVNCLPDLADASATSGKLQTKEV